MVGRNGDQQVRITNDFFVSLFLNIVSYKGIGMDKRPILDSNLDSATFRDYYFLKEELLNFCKENGISTSGGKIALTDRIAHFLETGEILSSSNARRKSASTAIIKEDARIEANFICSEKHRRFFKDRIGRRFTFNVSFQKWLKNNTGKTYREAIDAYYRLLDEKNKGKTTIERQFEYNTYIRDFFSDNKGKTLADAIKCRDYKKSLKGHNRYEKADLVAIKQ